MGIGSDYDGIDDTPVGLEDASQYPNLVRRSGSDPCCHISLTCVQFAALIKRGWTPRDLVGLAGGNLLRVMEGAEAVAEKLQGRPASMAIYDKRKDLEKWDL